MKVKYCGPAKDYSGYGEANRHDIAALVAAGVDVTTQIPVYTLEISDFGKLGEIATSRENKQIGYTAKILHTTPNVYPSFMEQNKYHIGRVFWETNKIPLDFAAKVELMDEVWTGSKYNADAIRNAGVTKPIYIIPEAIDTDVPENIDIYETPEIPKKAFKFYSIFEWTERKNPSALLEAYWRAFENRKDVALVLKTYVDNFTPDKKREIDQAIHAIKKRLNLKYYAPVYMYRGLMDRYQVYRFHKSFDCFVSAHRGEGWGIPQMEALLLGNPIISTNCGGIHEYLIDGIHGRLIPYTPVQLTENTRNKQWYTPDQQWAEVDIAAMSEAMFAMYKDRKTAKQMGANGKQLVKKLFSLEVVGALMRERLSHVSNDQYEVKRVEQVDTSHLQPGDILEPEQVVEERDMNGKLHSRFTIPALVVKNRIKVDYHAEAKQPE